MLETRADGFRVVFHPTLSWRKRSIDVVQETDLDTHRFFNLAAEIHKSDDQLAIAHVDRFLIEYRKSQWSVSVGRQPVSWGNGLVYQPLDLFSPYAPTAVDREFKSSNDSVLFERLFNSGVELQFLAIARREMDRCCTESSTVALKTYLPIGFNEIELLYARHYAENFAGISAQIALGGSVFRSDVGLTCGTAECETAGIVNIDYTFGIFGSPVYVFGEYFHNDFGMDSVDDGIEAIPSKLAEKLARGEVFGFTRDYLALGANFPVHPLWNVSTSVQSSLSDGSSILHTFLGYEPHDAVRIQAGFTVPFGSRDEEYGLIDVGDGHSTGGGIAAFAIFSLYR